METRWLFHRMQMPLEDVPHFDMLHPARRLWRMRGTAPTGDVEGCRLTTLERTLFDVNRVGDVPGLEIPGRFFRFLRSGDPRPLEPVLEHNRLDLVSLAAVMARARAARARRPACLPRQRGGARARPGLRARRHGRSSPRARRRPRARRSSATARAAESRAADVKGEALYRLALRHRRERRFERGCGDLAAGDRVDRAARRPARGRSRGRCASSPPKRWRSITSIAIVTSRAPASSRSSRSRKRPAGGPTACGIASPDSTGRSPKKQTLSCCGAERLCLAP